MKCREVLLRIQNTRMKEYKEYESLLLSTFGEIDEYSRSKLHKDMKLRLLELPYKYDSTSNESWIKKFSYDANKDSREVYKVRLEKRFPELGSIKTHNSFFKDNIYNQQALNNLINSILPKVTNVSNDLNENQIKIFETVAEDDISGIYDYKKIRKNIKDKDLKESSKKVYLSQTKQVLFPKLQKFESAPKEGIPLEVFADYLEHLENRCLRSYKDQPYRDLIEVRLLFYISLPTNALQGITREHIRAEDNVIRFEHDLFPVPETFIQLAETLFAPKEPLFKRNCKQICKFVLETSKSANLSKMITPTLIRRSLEDICYRECFYKELLKRR